MLILTFVEVTGKKLAGGLFTLRSPPPSRIGCKKHALLKLKIILQRKVKRSGKKISDVLKYMWSEKYVTCAIKRGV